MPGNKHSLGLPKNLFFSFLTPGLRGKLKRGSIAVRLDPPITMNKLLPAPSVEGDPGRVATLRRYRYLIQFPAQFKLKKKRKKNPESQRKTYLELNTGWNDDRPEREGMRANRRNHNGRNAWMNHGCSGCHSVSRRSRRSRHNQTYKKKICQIFVRLLIYVNVTITISLH